MEPNSQEVERIIKAALIEDIGIGDATSETLISKTATAHLSFVTREPIIMCGGWIVPKVLAQLNVGIKTEIRVEEGKRAEANALLIGVEGNARALLTGERTALNLLQRMASIATQTAKYVEALRGTQAILLDTRKTMPGLRALDKYAVRVGGGTNHRMGLYDAILIKDNHIAVCGSIAEAIKKAAAGNMGKLPVEVECDTLEQVKEALDAGATRILLDNMSLGNMRDAVSLNKGRAKLEASGNINLENIRSVGETGVDFISVGKLTSSVQNVDIGLDVTVKL